MNRARRKNNKRGRMKRLISESFFLSCTRFLSSRVVRFFETGLASPLLTTVKKTDSFFSDALGPLLQKIDLRKSLILPLCKSISSFISRSRVTRKINSARASLLNLTMRSVGIFLFLYAIYTAATFAVKRYISTSLDLGVANTDAVIVAAISLIVGLLLMLFGDKSILSTLSTGRITGNLLESYLGVNGACLVTTPQKGNKTSVAGAVLFGTVLGALTLFYNPLNILAGLLLVILGITVLLMPEFGLLLSVSTFTFFPVKWIELILLATLISYLIKCVRLKRNLYFGTADIIVLLMFVCVYITYGRQDGMNHSEKDLLLFTSLYFMAKNLICSERLLKQTFNALCGGLRIGMALYIFSEFSMYIYHDNLRMAANWITSSMLSVDMLMVMSAVTLPFAFTKISSAGRRSQLLTVLLVLACAVVVDSFIFYALALVSVFVYVMMAYKAPVGSILGGALVLVPSFAVISRFASFHIPVSVSEHSAALATFDMNANFWQSSVRINGIVGTAVFVIACLLVLQRVLGCMALNRTRVVSLYCGTVVASVIMLFACSFIFNLFADFRVYGSIWLILGLCGSAYGICSRHEYSVMEE